MMGCDEMTRSKWIGKWAFGTFHTHATFTREKEREGLTMIRGDEA